MMCVVPGCQRRRKEGDGEEKPRERAKSRNREKGESHLARRWWRQKVKQRDGSDSGFASTKDFFSVYISSRYWLKAVADAVKWVAKGISRCQYSFPRYGAGKSIVSAGLKYGSL